MINLTSWHNWVALAAMLLLIGLALHKLGARVPAVGKVVQASFGA